MHTTLLSGISAGLTWPKIQGGQLSVQGHECKFKPLTLLQQHVKGEVHEGFERGVAPFSL
jgi:hypothetical protein